MRSGPVTLLRHPASPGAPAALAIEAACRVEPDGALIAWFQLRGPIDEVTVPAAATAARVDGLWRHTCCELFASHAGGSEYLEFNLSPSGEWAAYAFGAYRTPEPAPELAPPSITTTRSAAGLELRARLDGALWSLLGGPATLHVGMSAVIEGRDGTLGYYALRHPLQRPDFHDARGFALRVERRAAPVMGGVL